jgi:hypothetical protein
MATFKDKGLSPQGTFFLDGPHSAVIQWLHAHKGCDGAQNHYIDAFSWISSAPMWSTSATSTRISVKNPLGVREM